MPHALLGRLAVLVLVAATWGCGDRTAAPAEACPSHGARCGTLCCYGDLQPDGFASCVLPEGVRCAAYATFRGILRVSTVPVVDEYGREVPASPPLRAWEYAADGSEGLLVADWTDTLADAGCTNHCYASKRLAWVFRIADRAVLHVEDVTGRPDFDIRSERSSCPYLGPNNVPCFGLAAPDAGVVVWVRSDYPWTSRSDPIWRFEGSALAGALRAYRLSNRIPLPATDLPLL